MFALRFLLFRLLLAVVLLLFAITLAYYQLAQGGELRRASEQNHLRWVRAPAPRGLMVDRRGRVLATNAQSLTAWLIPGEVPRERWDHLQSKLVELGVYPDLATATRDLANARRFPGYLPVRLQCDLHIAAISRLEEQLAFLPGIYLQSEPVRHYPHGLLTAHVIGYMREINADELVANREKGYRSGDYIGKSGLERALETSLRGVDGGQQVEVDANGRVLHTLQTVRPQPGPTLALTLDMEIQQAAEQSFRGRAGAAVALDPSTGDVLAMVSSPAYDLNRMSGRISRRTLAWLRGPRRPELNRATAGVYPPGSVFKIITAVAAVEQGVASPTASFFCGGAYHNIHCWKRAGHGALNLTDAIAQSCNVSFMKMAEQVGIQQLAEMARRFGLGQTTDITLLPERYGTVPDPAWARRVYHRRWELGETLQVGIGQSALEITPLQGARVIAAIANGGNLVSPRLVARIGKSELPPGKSTPLGLKKDTLRQVTKGLQAVVSEGTARQLDPRLHIAGKTGTAQNPGGDDHAWFVGFAPVNHPRVAVAVLVEHGGHGGAIAAPIAEAIIRAAL